MARGRLGFRAVLRRAGRVWVTPTSTYTNTHTSTYTYRTCTYMRSLLGCGDRVAVDGRLSLSPLTRVSDYA